MHDQLLAAYIRFQSQVRRDTERGASAVEYGLLLAGVAAIITTGVWAYSGVVVELFDDTCTHISAQLAKNGTANVATCK